MTEAIQAYPLSWPPNFPRAKSYEKGSFKASLTAALDNVQNSLKRFAADSAKKLDGIVISSNVALGIHRPTDPGVAVWFIWDGLQVCIPVDRYSTVEGNLQAIHHIIEARRTELRHGTLALVRATFHGFVALPAPELWWQVLGLKGPNVTREEITHRHRRLISEHHPDNGGDTDQAARINRARDIGLDTIGDNSNG